MLLCFYWGTNKMSIIIGNYIGPKSNFYPIALFIVDQLTHLNSTQCQELYDLFDSYYERFSDKPGFCSYFQNHSAINKEFKSKRLREYRIPELMKAEIQR